MSQTRLPEALWNPVLSRRRLLAGSALGLGALAWPLPLRAGGVLGKELDAALTASPLVYISPLRSDGSESRCHGEVWFVRDGDAALVVTAADRWRAVALKKGLDSARLWVGDHGVWQGANEAWTQSPSFRAQASFEEDPAARAKALAAFGAKYPGQWGSWGPRFRKGLEDGSRVLLRYRWTAEGAG